MFINKRQKAPQPRQAKPAGLGLASTLRKPPTSFGSGSTKTAVTQREEKRTLDLDDISLSSEESYKRFLKEKSEKDDTEVKKVEKKYGTGKDVTKPSMSFERPKTSRGSAGVIPKPKMSSSSALNRLAMLEANLKSRQEIHSQNKMSLSGSDFDLDISSDMEIKREVGRTNERLRDKLEEITKKRSTKKGQSILLNLDDESVTSEDDSTAHKRFLKKPDVRDVTREQSDSEISRDGDFLGKKGFPKKDQNVYKVHGSTDFDESEVSLQAYMQSIDKEKDSKKSGSSKKVTFASDLVRSSDLEQSLDDFMPRSNKSDDPSSLDEVIPSKLHNIMSLDDLIPSQQTALDKDDEDRPISALGFVGLHSVDELLPAATDVRSSSEYVPSMSEDIQEASDKSSNQSSSDGPVNVLQNLRSIDDLQASDSEPVLKITSTPIKPQAKESNVFKARAAVESDGEEIRSESPNYTDDFQSDDDTLKETESITQDISEESRSVPSSIHEADSRESGDVSRSSYSTSYTESSISSSSTMITRTPSPVRRKPKKVQSAQVQTDIATGIWMPGSVYADTTSFKPSRLIDNEALDVLTSYNPANLAIQDLLRQQVTLTREFVARSRRLHDLAVATIPCDYVYGEVNTDGLERLKRICMKDDSPSVSAK